MSSRHFLNLLDLSKDELQTIIARAIELKSLGLPSQTLSQKTLGLIFEKSSTRTRVAFEVAMTQLGGNSLFLSNQDSQLGRGEPVADSARVLSRMVDCLAIRTFDQAMLEEFALHSNVPVINALSDDFHPCQLLADMQTYVEHKGSISGKTVSWIGDGNNMCQSYINAAIQFDFELKIASPFGYEPRKDLLELSPNRVSLLRSPSEAVAGSDLVVTDVWSSMGQEEEQARRKLAFADYQVTEELMSKAHSDALFMHCLPAHRGEEVSTKLLDREDSVVWDEAENRMHSQKALLEFMLNS
ncbi:MAG: ornithine carbamoyltransferase [Gammaproteobacteria bacterium]|jgi:ornithine carbamoyltransferase|nr:ornithine carbamoyltransferase [Gammaproteobacteria bacterium]